MVGAVAGGGAEDAPDAALCDTFREYALHGAWGAVVMGGEGAGFEPGALGGGGCGGHAPASVDGG